MLRGFIALLLSMGIRLLTSMVLFIFMAHAWGAEPFGRFMYVLSIATLLTLFCEFGFSQQILKEAGEAPERVDELMSRFLNAKLWLTLCTWMGVIGYSVTGALTIEMAVALCLLTLSSTILSYADYFLAFLRARGHYKKEMEVTAAGNIALFLLAAAAIHWASVERMAFVCLAFIAARFFNFLLAVRAYRLIVSPTITLVMNLKQALGTMKKSLAYGIDVAVGTAFANVDGILVSNVLGFAANGVYQAAARFYQGACLLPPLFASLFLPKISRAISMRQTADAQHLIRRLYVSMILLGLLIMAAFTLSGPVIDLIYHDESLSKAAALMPLFGILIFIRFIAAAQGIMVTALNGQAVRVALFVIALAVLVSAGFPLLKLQGLQGIILASTIAYIVLSTSFWIWVDTKGHAYRKLISVSHLLAFSMLAFYFSKLTFR